MHKNELFWAIISVSLIILAYLLPYTMLTNVARWYGSLLLWTIIPLVVIGINYILAKDWSDAE